MSDISSFSPLWGEWYVKELIGKGTFGAVYRAEKTEYGNTYTSAVKHISIPNDSVNAESLISEGVVSDEASVKKYFDAVRDKMISEINFCYALRGNTNIVSYEDHCIIPKADGAGYDIFIRMEHLTALPKYMRENSFTEKDIIRLGIDICSALEVLDKHKIIHRDIKPANIFVNSVGVYKLGDFGESKVLSNTNMGMTVRGTYTYMSPEISMGRSANITADIYSLGIVMYRLLNGNKAPFVPADAPSVDAQTVENANVRRFRGEKMPLPAYCTNSQLAAVIMKACEYEPSARWQTPREFRKTLENLLEGTAQPVNVGATQAPAVPYPQMTGTPTQNTAGSVSFSSADTRSVPGQAAQNPQNTGSGSPEPPKGRSKLRIIIPVFIALVAAACVVTILVLGNPPTGQEKASESSVSAQSENVSNIEISSYSSVQPSVSEISTVISTPESRQESDVQSRAESIDESSAQSSAESSTEPREAELVSIAVLTPPAKTVYSVGEAPDIAGLVVEALYSDGTRKEIPVSELNVGRFDSSGPGEKKLVISYGTQSTELSLTVEEKSSGLNGKCGMSATYSFNKDNGTLTISGKGPMDDYSLGYAVMENGSVGVQCSVPWSGYAADIKTVVVDEGITRIGKYSFYDCTNLTGVKLSDTVKLLGASSFRGCSSLKTFNIPAGLEDMEEEVFINCRSLSSFSADIKNYSFSTVDGLLYSKSKMELIKCPEAKTGAIVLPYGVWSIENWAFDSCKGITSIELPDSVTSIGGYAFSGCTGISRIVISKNTTMMGGSAFRGWKSDQTIDIPGYTSKPSLWANDWNSECNAKINFANS
ncbi:MAG: leucine-rich repeat protein [Clostridia bacterium]|nr:leucine-rich repeat protein [Clostridia bacterium]